MIKSGCSAVKNTNNKTNKSDPSVKSENANEINCAGAGASNNVEGSDGVIGVGGGKCAICSKSSKSRCSSCNEIYYCSVNHQKQDWKRHKLECRPFIVKSNEKFGRYLVAARNIKAGEIALKEAPLIYGPTEDIVCVGCLKEPNRFLQCERCGWPICQRECQNHPDHKAECDYTIKTRGCKIQVESFPLYHCLTILRFLLLKNTNPKKWKRLMQLESHEEYIRKTIQWQSDFMIFKLFMQRFFKCNEWFKDEILKVSGILRTNAFRISSDGPASIGVFDYGSLIQHSCIPNLTKSFTEKNEIVFWAPYDIKKGTNLSVSYVDGFRGTVSRQEFLKLTKLFKCECERCKDVTEFGTFYSALKCNKEDCDGLALPRNLETLHQDWRCKKCAKILNKSYVSDILEKAEIYFALLNEKSATQCIRYINLYTNFLSKHHYLICKAKLALVKLVTVDEETLTRIDDELLIICMHYCKEMIELFEKLAPVSVIGSLGLLCFDMHTLLMEYSARSCSRNNRKRKIEESLEYVNKSINYLHYNTISAEETYEQAKKNKNMLKSMLEFIDRL